MRIVAGRFRGRTLASPSDRKVRPTSDRVRESLFDILTSRLDDGFEGLAVLDLFAGSGALGIEALSRGAERCVFVDNGPEARGCLAANIETFGLGGITKVLRRDATILGDAGKFGPFDLVFADPPYAKGLGEKALAAAAEGGWIAPGAMVVLEEKRSADVDAPDGLNLTDTRTYGETALLFFEMAPA